MTSKGQWYPAIGIEAPAIQYKHFEEGILEMSYLWEAADSEKAEPKSFQV